MKVAKKSEGTKATISGDGFIINGKRYIFNQISKKNGKEVRKQKMIYNLNVRTRSISSSHNLSI